MAFTDWVKKNVAGAREAINIEITKFKSKELLEAIVGASALVAYADGTISSEEKQKLMGYLRTSEQLKVFDQSDVIALFQKYAGKFEFDTAIGTGEVMQAVGKFKGKPQAQLVIRVCCAIGAADGNFDEQEKTVVRRMCSELDLNLADFGL